MKKPCSQCSHPTNRHDDLCSNCYYTSPTADNRQTWLEGQAIETYRFFCQCGESRTAALILMARAGVLTIQPGPPRSNTQRYRNDRVSSCIENPEPWYGMCHNCYQTLNNRPPGRPKKYTDEERKWQRANAPKIFNTNTKTRVIQSYGSKGQWPTCIQCNLPATRTLYIGEFGKAPRGNHALRCRRLALTDPHWHVQFAPYCDHHEVSNVGERHRQYKQGINQRMTAAIEESSLALAQLDHS